jgi:cysteine-rich repeat protein
MDPAIEDGMQHVTSSSSLFGLSALVGKTSAILMALGALQACGTETRDEMVSGDECVDENCSSDAINDAAAIFESTGFCGDGITNTNSEACDDGNTDPSDGCTNDCALSCCGDGITAPDETCDDGNVLDGDGCSHDCTTEAGWQCSSKGRIDSVCFT